MVRNCLGNGAPMRFPLPAATTIAYRFAFILKKKPRHKGGASIVILLIT